MLLLNTSWRVISSGCSVKVSTCIRSSWWRSCRAKSCSLAAVLLDGVSIRCSFHLVSPHCLVEPIDFWPYLANKHFPWKLQRNCHLSGNLRIYHEHLEMKAKVCNFIVLKMDSMETSSLEKRHFHLKCLFSSFIGRDMLSQSCCKFNCAQ